MDRSFVVVDVFTDVAFGGNQLAVLTDASGLTTAEMQAVAREWNFAESAFLGPPTRPGSAAAVRIFTPHAELPFAGHPTVGTAAVLVHLDVQQMGHFVLDEAVGAVGVRVEAGASAGSYRAELSLEPDLRVGPATTPPDRLASALGLRSGDVIEAWEAGVGVPFTFCRLSDAATVDAAAPDRAAVLGLGGPSEIVAFAGDPVDGGRLHARMWAPGLGIEEDPATGSAAAALIATVAHRHPGGDATVAVRIDQGVVMGRPSRLEASATRLDGRVVEVRVGGGVVVVADGTLRVP